MTPEQDVSEMTGHERLNYEIARMMFERITGFMQNKRAEAAEERLKTLCKESEDNDDNTQPD